jgi:hypothetical protein
MYIQAFQIQQGIGMLHTGSAVSRFYYKYTTNQQIQRKAQINPFYGYIHTRSI